MGILQSLVKNARILVLSPHLDDMLFSAYQLLEDTKADAWTVFAGAPADGVVTAWDRSLGFESGKALVEARRTEDTNAFEGYEGAVKQLDFLERAYVNPAQRQQDKKTLVKLIESWITEDADQPIYIFVPAGAGVPMPPPIWEKLRKNEVSGSPEAPSQKITVEDEASEEKAQISSAPAAPSIQARAKDTLRSLVGKTLHTIQTRRRRYYQSKGMLANEDHVALRDVVLENFAGRANVNLGLYDEYPYAWSRSAREWVAKNLPAATVYELPVDRENKYNRLKHYTSQTIAMDPEHKRFEQPETLPVNETYWLLGR